MSVRIVVLAVVCLAIAGRASAGPPTEAPPPGPHGVAPMRMHLDAGQPEFSAYGEPTPQDLPPIPEVWLKSLWNPQPRLEIRAEAVWLQPEFDRTRALARQFQSNDAFIFSLVDVSARADEYYVVAPRIAAELHANEMWSIEMTSFFLDGPNQDNVSFGQADVPYLMTTAAGGPMFNTPAGFPAVADSVTVDWDFETFNADATILRHCIAMHGPVSDFAIGIGARYFRIDEKARLLAVDELNGLSGQLDVDVENRMAGPQVVMRTRLQGPGKRIRSVAEAKIGLMANAAENSTALGAGGVVVATGFASQTRFAPLVEANFLFEFFVAEHATVFGGFQIYYLDRVERVAEQFNPDLAVFASGADRDIGTMFMFGPRVGIVFSY